MISERRLVSSHSSFWRHVMPMGESFVRFVNSSKQRYNIPFDFKGKPERNSLISELSFRIYQFCLENAVDPKDLSAIEEIIPTIAAEVVHYVSRLDKKTVIEPMQAPEILEAKTWAQSLNLFSLHVCPGQKVTPHPLFRGCGIVDACEGDLLVGRTLWEIKNVERDFRLADIKQLLAYCALNYASQQYSIDSIGLVNARHGLWFKTRLEPLATMASAMSESELLGEIVRYITMDAPSR